MEDRLLGSIALLEKVSVNPNWSIHKLLNFMVVRELYSGSWIAAYMWTRCYDAPQQRPGHGDQVFRPTRK